jgi:hypothetical protein
MAKDNTRQSKKRSNAARKGWETRKRRAREVEAKAKAQARARSEASRKGWERRREKEREKAAKAARREQLKHARAEVDLQLRAMLQLAAEGAGERRWKPVRNRFHRAKDELKHALKDSSRGFERYLDILDDIADANDCDWAIAY